MKGHYLASAHLTVAELSHPQKCFSASGIGSTPVLKKQSVGPLLREYSCKSGIVLPGVLPKRLFLYTGTGSDLFGSTGLLMDIN